MAENRQNSGKNLKNFRASGAILATAPTNQIFMYATVYICSHKDKIVFTSLCDCM